MSTYRATFLSVGLLSSLILGGCSSSEEPPQPTVDFATYSAEEFYQTTSQFGASINASADAVLTTSDASGVFNVYRQPLDGTPATQLSFSSTDAIMGISWFPEDDRILYSADNGGNELNHLFVLAEDGSVTDLTPGENLKASFMGWSDDKAFLYVATNERDPSSFDLYKVSLSGYQRELIFQNNESLSLEAVSPDGQFVAVVETLGNTDSALYLIEVSEEESRARKISEHEGEVNYSVFNFGPDSQSLYYSTNQHGEFVQAWRFDIPSLSHHVYYTADWDVTTIRFTGDGRYRVAAINEDAVTRVEIRDLEDDARVDIPNLPDGNLSGFQASADGQHMTFYVASDTSPANLYVYSAESESPVALSANLNPEIASENLVASEVVRFNSFDGLAIPGLLYKPVNASPNNRVPAVIWVHGGPGGQSRVGYNPMIQHLVNHGYAVFSVNNRGSSGYGKTFYHLDDLRHGEDDLQDIVFGKKHLQTLNWIDHDRIGIMGGSYGGYMTMAGMAFTDEFAVGINIFGVTNWERTLTSIPPWWESFKSYLYAEMGDPATDIERLRRISPLFHADQISRPVLVVQGANDPRVLQIESDEMVAAIRANGIPVEYVLFPDEGHGFRKKANRITASEAYLSFLNEYL
ncbi:S9 family peptidase [Umboniibacter marinipuniceus]|uniref:Prolyl oligopeptidase n=1 Tax=Umboniibacter marinipuniceus TaxID=569599 RepID=A0A3M0ABJ4_9GAMM|nr:S9 family peptidase [Umboniibacter marinipuniceus]RMA82543.1 prolyl oligopeptidase [Umboniibacter marinipuniceus]